MSVHTLKITNGQIPRSGIAGSKEVCIFHVDSFATLFFIKLHRLACLFPHHPTNTLPYQMPT